MLDVFTGRRCVFFCGHVVSVAFQSDLQRERHASATQYTVRHPASVTSSAGHTTGCSTRAALTSIATEQTIFADSQPSRLNAVANGDLLSAIRVAPRAISAPGMIAVAAPNNADHNAGHPNISPTSSEITAPASACTNTTRHGDGALR